MVRLSELRDLFDGTIKLNEPLAKYTALQVGGPADYVLEPHSRDALAHAVGYFRKNAFPYIFLRPNMLVSDSGFRGAALLAERSFEPAFFERRCAQMFKPLPGVSIPDLIERAGLNGLTWGGATVLADCVVNANHARAADILALVRHVQRRVRLKLGIRLEMDIQPVGFDDEPLANVA